MVSKTFYFSEDEISEITGKIPGRGDVCNAIICDEISCGECPIDKFIQEQEKNLSNLITELKQFKRKLR